MSSGDETATKSYALLKPIKDLAKNWNIDIAQELEQYIHEIENLEFQFEGQEGTLNFAEAALLIQGSACVYSRKVEYLYKLVYETLDLLASKKRAAQATSINASGEDEDVAELITAEALAHEEFLSLDDVASVQDEAALQLRPGDGQGSAALTSIVLVPPELLPTHTNSSQIYTPSGEVIGNRTDFRMNTMMHDGSFFSMLNASAHQGATTANTAANAMAMITEEDAGMDGAMPHQPQLDESFNDFDNGFDDDFDEIGLEGPTDDGAGDVNSALIAADGDHFQLPPITSFKDTAMDPWAPVDPHTSEEDAYKASKAPPALAYTASTTATTTTTTTTATATSSTAQQSDGAPQQEAATTMSPLQQHLHQSMPKSIFMEAPFRPLKKYLRNKASAQQHRKPTKANPVQTLPLGNRTLSEFFDKVEKRSTVAPFGDDYRILDELWKKEKKNARATSSKSDGQTKAASTDKNSDGDGVDVGYVAGKGMFYGSVGNFATVVPQDVHSGLDAMLRLMRPSPEDMETASNAGDDVDNDDFGDGGFDGPDFDGSFDVDFDNNNDGGDINIGNPSDFSPFNVDGTETSYEELVRRHVAQFVAESQRYAQDTDLTRRVREWEERIKPVLDEETKHRPFDIHEYGEEVLQAFDKASTTPDSSQEFSSLALATTPFEVARKFLATLQLANLGNIEIVGSLPATGDADPNHAAQPRSFDDMHIKLLKTEQHHKTLHATLDALSQQLTSTS